MALQAMVDGSCKDMQKLKLNNKGETLIETVISVMLFTILFVGVAGMLTQAENIIRQSKLKNEEVQDTVNIIISGDNAYNPDIEIITQPVDINVTLTTSSDKKIAVSARATLMRTDSLVYFYGG